VKVGKMLGVSIVFAIIGLVHGARAQETAGSWQIGVATRALSYTQATITTQSNYFPPIVNERSSWDWGFGERSNVGLRWFAARWLSIDPAVVLRRVILVGAWSSFGQHGCQGDRLQLRIEPGRVGLGGALNGWT
jgi:hypothetical protein